MLNYADQIAAQFRRMAAVEGKTITEVNGQPLTPPSLVNFTYQPGFASEHMQADNNPQVEYLPADVVLKTNSRIVIAGKKFTVREITLSADGVTKFASLSEA